MTGFKWGTNLELLIIQNRSYMLSNYLHIECDFMRAFMIVPDSV